MMGEHYCTRSKRDSFSGVQARIPGIPQPHIKKGRATKRIPQAGQEPGFSATISFVFFSVMCNSLKSANQRKHQQDEMDKTLKKKMRFYTEIIQICADDPK